MDKKTDRWMWAGALPASFAVGLGISWWWSLPPTPWMQFTELSASYQPGVPAIKTSGWYKVNSPCDPQLVVWRIEGIATDGQILEYGPKKPIPSLSKGTHEYDSSIPLEAKISPDGWEVRILVTCRGRTPETIEAATLVSIVEAETPP